MAFDSSENPQKGPQSVQVSVLPLKVEHGRVGIPGNFRVLKVRSAEVQNEGTGSVSVRRGARTVCSPMCSRIFATSRCRMPIPASPVSVG
jgi:hypothetical protein